MCRMANAVTFIIINFLLLYNGFCEINVEEKHRLFNGFLDSLNNLPNQLFIYEDGTIKDAQKVDENHYKITAYLKATDLSNLDSTKHLQCRATIRDLKQNGIVIENNTLECEEYQAKSENTGEGGQAGDSPRQSVTADTNEPVLTQDSFTLNNNEVLYNPVVTSDDVPIPRPKPSMPCIGCSTQVDPQAQGVEELAALGIKHLDKHETEIKHKLDTVVEVTRQVQVVNGIRYILTLIVDKCEKELYECNEKIVCKVSILEKPWLKLPSGSKYRAILANNCTEQWQYGDDGEVISDEKDDKTSNKNSQGNEEVKVIHNTDLQAQPHSEKTLTDEQIKDVEKQIIPYSELQQTSITNDFQNYGGPSVDYKQQVTQDETAKYFSENATPFKSSAKEDNSATTLTDDKKKAIDELTNLFNFAGFNNNAFAQSPEYIRVRRSFNEDLQVMAVAEKFHNLKNKIENAKYLYLLADEIVKDVNKKDNIVNNRTLKEIITADEEIDEDAKFYYIQARVVTPCDELEYNKEKVEICNGITKVKKGGQRLVITSFCTKDEKNTYNNVKIESIPLDDPKLHKLSAKALKKIERESVLDNALKILKIIDANSQRISPLNTVTRISLVLGYTNCTKTSKLRSYCTVLKVMGVNVCNVEIHEHILTKESEIMHICLEAPADGAFNIEGTKIAFMSKKFDNRYMKALKPGIPSEIDVSKSRSRRQLVGGQQEKNPSNPQYHALAEESLQKYMLSSGNTQHHKVVKVDKVTVQVVSGSLTRIDFTIIPTNCQLDSKGQPSSANCETESDANTISCHSEVWEQPWLNKKEITVNCNIDESKTRRKRGIPGGQQEKNPSDPQYHALAEESLQKYMLSSGNTQHHKVVKVDKVTVQVVSGSLTRIDFTIIPTNCQLDSKGQPSSANCETESDANTISCHSEVWEQPWLNKKEITVNCNIDESKTRRKRGIPGGQQEKDPSNPQYHALAEESLQKYMLSSGNTQQHKVIKVDKVTVQVVSGSLTRIDFTIIPTNCQLDSNGQPSSANCESETDADTISCHSEVWEQPWLNKKEITVNCNIDESKTRRKRDILGGQQEKNPTDPQYHALAEESLQKYMLSSGNTQHHKVVKVDKVTVQVVSGSLTRIAFTIIPTNCQLDSKGQPSSANCETESNANTISCYSEVWEQPWLNKKEITVNCNIDESKTRRKKSIRGGQKEKNPSDPQYHALAEESLQKYMLSSGNTQHHKVVKVDKVTVQVVSGSLTRIDFTIIPTNCQLDSKGQPSSANCESKSDADTISCHSEVWEQPWLNKKQITVNCNIEESNSRRKRQIYGGLQEQNPSDPQYHVLAEESLQKYMLSSRNTQHHKVLKVDKVTFQVVSGSLTRIDFTIIPTNCQLDSKGQPSSANCETESDADTISCHSEVLEQTWLNKKEITVNCNIDESKTRRKRGIPGGQQEKNPSDPQYHALAEESLQKYMISSGNTQHHKVVKVDNVTVQVVSGSLIRIDFTIIPTNCQLDSKGQPSSANCETESDANTISCHSEVWEQPWLNKKEITVNCNIDESKTRRKRGIPGGQPEKDPSNPQYHALAEESLQKYMLSSGNTQHHKVIKVDKVTVQVVSGSLTRIDFTIIPTNCQLDSNGQPSSANCESETDADTISCHSEVWEQPWLNKKQITVNCNIEESNSRRKRQIYGGLQEQNPSDPQYHVLAEESLQKYMLSSRNTQHHKVLKVDKVTFQVVSGSLTRIDFTIIPTNCQLDSKGQPSSAICETESDADTISCHSEVLEQTWLNKKEITVNCNIDESKTRRKRGIPGGQQEKNPSDPQYHALAEESLQKYMLSSGNTQHHKVVKVDNVTVQVVSGSLTRIDFTIIPTNCQLDGNGQPSSANCESESDADTISCHSEILEQTWLNKKEITVNCNIDESNSRRKRQIYGGQQEKNPSDPQYHALAKESLQKYMLSSGNTQHHKVVKVDNVTVQVVSGSLTRIDFTIIPTNCQLDGNGQPSSANCESESDADTISCHSEILEQTWLNKKEITVNCNIDESNSRRKRQIYGGQQEKNPSDPQYHALAEESLQKYMLSSGNTQHHKVVKVDNVTVQVVSGSLIRIDFTIIPTNCQLDSKGQPSSANCETESDANTISCHSEVWEQPWLNKKEITVNCNIDESKTRRKRGIPGGQQEKDPSNPQYHALAEESLQKYMLSSGNTQHHKVIKVDKVTVQVVSGSLTRIDFTIIPTNCQLDSNGQPSSANCESETDADTISCHSEVWEQPWLNKKEITVNCNIDESKTRRKRDILGGQQEKNPTDPQYHALAEESLQKYILSSGNTQHHKVVKVDKVTVQVVSGSLTRIDFTIIPTKCQLDSKGQPSSAICETESDANTISCYSEVWEQPWLNKKEITVNCNIDESKTRRKKSIRGGQKEKNPSDPQYHALAEESLQKYMLSSGNTQHHKVVKVDKVTVQVVSGSLTRIDFTIIPTNCQLDSNRQPSSANCESETDADTISCHSEVWEQPWLNKKEITVNCNIDESKTRRKRGILGGQQEKNPTDPQYHALAEESLQKYMLSSGNTQHHKVVKVYNVTVQVVSGSLTRIDFTIIPTNCQLDSNGQPSSANCESEIDADTISCHSEVLEQTWLNKKEITVNCNIDESKTRRKRGILGGQQEKNPSDPQYHALAEESLQKYMLSSGNTQHHKVVKVYNVTVQVVSGSLTRIDFTIIPTNCQLDSNGQPSSANCESEINADTISCHSEVLEQSWLNKKEITVNCNIDESKTRRKRGIPGGQQEKNPSDPPYHALAEESLQKYLLSSGNTQHHKVVKVDKVTVQVVSGSLTRIDFTIIPTNCQLDSNGQPSSANCESETDADTISCHSEVWEQPWLNKKEITVNCNIDESKTRRKRGILGGQQEKNPTDPQYHALAEESLEKYMLSSGNTQHHKVVKVDKVTVQVVSGSLTRIDFTIIPTNCQLDSKGQPSSANCETESDANTISCHSEVWEQPWLNKKDITVNCNIDESKTRRKRGILGGQQEKNPSDPQYHALAEESLQKYMLSSGNTQHHKVVKVYNVTVQVVSGSLTRIDFTIIPTNCQLDSNGQPSSANCESEIDADTISCHSEVLEQTWLNKKEITVNCNIDESKTRRKRGIPGGQQEKNPSDPPYHALAEESLQKYLLSSGNTQHHKVVKVDKVTVQVVSGSLTRIDFTIIPTNCQLDSKGQPSSANCGSKSDADTINCHSEVWEQPWLNKKQITVNCNIKESNSRRKRQIYGGLQEQNPSDPQYHVFAEESLQKYMLSSRNTQHHKVLKVDKVTFQVVSGSLTRIDFTIIPTNCQLDSKGQPSSANCETESDADTISCHSEVLEQTWLNKKEITVNCNIDESKTRRKRGIPGGQQEKNPSDPQYHALAEESLQKYMLSSGNTQHHKVVKVDNVTVQVVSGSLTRIDFTIIPTNCQLDGNGQPSSANCESESDADTISCHSEILEQTWLNKKEITVNCNIDESNSRRKRQIYGGQQEKNPSDPQYHALAKESLQKYMLSSGNTHHHKVVKVNKVTVQVVSGSLTRIDFTIIPTNCQLDSKGQPSSANCGSKSDADTINCHSEVWEQPWLNKKEITVNCNIEESKTRRKRGIPGGQQEKNPSDPQYHALAEESLQKYMLSSGNIQHHKVVKVDKVTVQVVSGSLTRIDFTIIPTNCQLDSKGQPSSANCESESDADTISCHSEVWEQPWLNKKEITVNCNIDESKTRSKRGLAGGHEEKNPEELKYHTLAEESLQKYLLLSGSTQNHKVIKVEKVTVQVVSGSLTRIDFTIIPTNCYLNSSGQSTSSNCDEQSNAAAISCHSEIWEQPWLNKKEITVNCDNDDTSSNNFKRKKRAFVGGPQNKDVTKPMYKRLAEESLRKFEHKHKSKQHYMVVDIKHVVEQVVSGFIYKIDFTATPTNCSTKISDVSKCYPLDSNVVFHCHAEIVDHVGGSKKKIAVQCREKLLNRDFINEDNTNDNNFHTRSFHHKSFNKGDHMFKRLKRQVDEDMDDELINYYAENAVSYINDRSQTHNLQKLITIHSVQNSVHMNLPMVRMYIETAYTYCLRGEAGLNLRICDELEGMNHRICLVRVYPSPFDEQILELVTAICNDEDDFEKITGISFRGLLKMSIAELEKSPDVKYKYVSIGEPQVIPSLDSNVPTKLNFIVFNTNCTKDVDMNKHLDTCVVDPLKTAVSCVSYVYMEPNSRDIRQTIVRCKQRPTLRKKRFVSSDSKNMTEDEKKMQKMAEDSLEKLELESQQRYKQRIIQINNYATKITTGQVTTINFDVGYTSCLKYEWIDDVTKCELLEHLPRRNCISNIWEGLWTSGNRLIEVNCKDDEIPLEAHIEFDSAKIALHLANKAITHIEAKYPTYRKQKLVRIFSIDKQNIAGIHYKMKIEVGFTDCWALSPEENCTLLEDYVIPNRFCRVNVWLRPWTENPPAYRVTCDYDESLTGELYHNIQAEVLFYNFVKQFSPSYAEDSIEMAKRFLIFKENVKKIQDLNIHERGTATYGITRFADLTYEEFTTFFTGLKPNLRHANNVPMRKAHIPNIKLPQNFDWRDFNAVTEVKDQGSCGSCWAFSVTGNIEGQWKKHSGQLVSLSEQELVDCDKLDEGCNGGLPDNAYRAIEQLGGLETETEYPYQGDGEKCVFNKTLAKVQISGAVNISSNETDMAKWLVRNGPISIGINANAMQFYVGGVSHPWRMLCNPNNLDHGVLIVGYGIKEYPLFNKRLPYWIVKNSWGRMWGEQGYYRVYRGDGTCGLNLMASSAVIDN